eukprot:tig00000270_g23916.t1
MDGISDGDVKVTIFGANGEMQAMGNGNGGAGGFTTNPGYITFKNLGYSVKAKDDSGKTVDKVLLKDITGYVHPGMMIALMGPSGGGKTTLMDVLANRKTGGNITGTVLVNGKPKDKFFSRIAGYVEQFDLLLGTQVLILLLIINIITVRDAVVFSAMLRLPDTHSREEKVAFAERVMGQLDLHSHANSLLGPSSSAELRKRTTIAIEMVSNPSLLFLDEPTSGLDSVAAMMIMRSVKGLARSGVAVICTIHQPSSSLFAMFDWLLLLRRGGRVAYFGPLGENSRSVLGYFEGQAAASFRRTQVASEAATRTGSAPAFGGRYATGFGTQVGAGVKECTKRAFRANYRRPAIFRAVILRAVSMALIGGTLYYLNRDGGQVSARTKTSFFWFALVFFALGSLGSISGKIEDRDVFYREDSQGTFRPSAQLLAWIIAENPRLGPPPDF